MLAEIVEGAGICYSSPQRGELMTKEGEVYICDICGNEVKVIKSGGGSLVCCGVKMRLSE
jgi:desulfoferrodoxin-like iron-binding protein